MDGWICVLIIVLAGLACVVACLAWHGKVGFDKEKAQYVMGGLFEQVKELVGRFFVWVRGYVEELIDKVGIGVLVAVVSYIAICCYGEWAFGHYVMGYMFDLRTSDWGQYFAVMTGVGFMFFMIWALFFGLFAVVDDLGDYIVVIMIPLLVSVLFFVVFGAITIVIRSAG
jgi:hypothetical protein